MLPISSVMSPILSRRRTCLLALILRVYFSHLSQLMIMAPSARLMEVGDAQQIFVPENILELSCKSHPHSSSVPSLHSLSLYHSSYRNLSWDLMSNVCLPSSTILWASGSHNRVSFIFVSPSPGPQQGAQDLPQRSGPSLFIGSSPTLTCHSRSLCACTWRGSENTRFIKKINSVLPLPWAPQTGHHCRVFLMWIFLSIGWYFRENLDSSIILTTFYVSKNQP